MTKERRAEIRKWFSCPNKISDGFANECLVEIERLESANTKLQEELEGYAFFVSPAMLEARINQLTESNQRLAGFVEFFANCPCCQETAECHPECTFREDVHEDDSYQRMVMARQTLHPTIYPAPDNKNAP